MSKCPPRLSDRRIQSIGIVFGESALFRTDLRLLTMVSLLMMIAVKWQIILIDTESLSVMRSNTASALAVLALFSLVRVACEAIVLNPSSATLCTLK